MAALAGATVLVGAAGAAQAAVVFDGSPGTGEPPATLGPYTMVPAPEDTITPDYTPVGTAPLAGGVLTFGASHTTYTAAGSWASDWGGWNGHRIYFNDGADESTMTLPVGTSAFYFYAAENLYGTYDITATAQDGTSSGPISVTTGPPGTPGAQYFGFYGTGGDTIATVVVSSPGTIGLAVGRFATSDATPECDGLPATITGDGTVNGTPGDDVIVTGAGDDIVKGGNGNDVICTGIGNDIAQGDSGNDRVFGGDGNDTVKGAAGADVVDGGEGDDALNGGDGHDTLRGQGGKDMLNGGNANDTVVGGAGSDALAGNAGTDHCAGDANGGPVLPGVDKVTSNGSCESIIEVP